MYSIFPVKVERRENGKFTKKPMVSKWQEQTLDNPEEFSNLGVSPAEGIVIFDVDTYKGISTDDIDLLLGCELNWDEALLQTTPSGGHHYVFATNRPIRQGVDIKGLVGFDIRVSGKGWIATGEGYSADVPTLIETLSGDDPFLVDLPDEAVAALEETHTKDDSFGDDLFNLCSKLDITLEDASVDLSKLPESYTEDRDNWLKIGMGLHHQFDGSEDAYQLFDTFSQRTTEDNYNQQANRRTWDSFGNGNGGVTYATIKGLLASQETRVEIKKDSLRTRLTNEIAEHTVEAIEDEIGFTVNVNKEQVFRALTCTLWSPSKKAYFVVSSTDQSVKHFDRTNLQSSITKYYGTMIDNNNEFNDYLEAHIDDSDKPLSRTDKNRIKSTLFTALRNHIETENQKGKMEASVDMFTDESRFVFERDHVHQRHAHKPMAIDSKFKDYDQEIVDKYKTLFPQLDEVVSMIVASRFASSRKNAYLWIKAPSNWGKDLFMCVLGELCVEMSVKEVESAIEGKPVGKTPEDFFRAFVMCVNEFKSVKSELKQLEDSIPLSPKNQLESRVPLYTKLFLSAESVDSLVGEHGVEAQFANRFSLLEMTGTFADLNVKSEDQYSFRENVASYVRQFVNKQVLEYRSLGVEGAASRGDAYLNLFHGKYKISTNTKTLDDNIEEIADEIKGHIIDRYSAESARTPGQIHVTGLVAKIKQVIADRDLYTQSESGMLGFKAVQIRDVIQGNQPQTTRLKDFVIRDKTTGLDVLHNSKVMKVVSIDTGENDTVDFDDFD